MATENKLSEASALLDEPTFSDPSGKRLRKSLSYIHAFAYIVGQLFGSGIFISPSLVARETSNMGMAIVVWVVSAIPCLFGALCFCELAIMLQKTGGEYVFIKEAFGNVAAFVTAWTQTFVIHPSGKAVLAVTVSEHIISPFYDIQSTYGPWVTKVVAICVVLIVFIINCVSTSFVTKTQLFFTMCQTIAVIVLAALGLWKVSTGHTSNYYHMFANTTADFDFGSFGLALYNGLWAYDGWGLIANITEELHNVQRDLWLSIVTGIPFAMLCYVLINLALMSVLSRDEIARSETVATTFVGKIFGKKAALIMPPVVALSCFSCMNGAYFMQLRTVLSAAREGQLPEPLSYIHRDKRTPVPAAVFLFILTALWILAAGTGIQTLITSFSFAVWLMYGLAIASVFVLRVQQPNAPRAFKVWIANPIFTDICAMILVIAPFIKRPVESSVTSALILLSLPVYYFLVYKHDSLPELFKTCKKKIYAFILDHTKLVPCIFDPKSEEEDDNSNL
eukprot:Seg2412.3 transcript_id=Seg2412.3/GoldUCD/mRNA.D3Y31 product="Glycoprotein-associated_amino acid transporter b0,+AT1" protein_id=Seg2412.3/GoldUCD/D3Y31